MPLKSYLKSLATDSKTLDEFKKNPDEALKKAGLSPEQIKAVKSGDTAAIRKDIGGGAHAQDTVVVLIL